MRTSQKLVEIASRALNLREHRGDTEWSPDERAAVNAAHQLLNTVDVQSAIQPIVVTRVPPGTPNADEDDMPDLTAEQLAQAHDD